MEARTILRISKFPGKQPLVCASASKSNNTMLLNCSGQTHSKSERESLFCCLSLSLSYVIEDEERWSSVKLGQDKKLSFGFVNWNLGVSFLGVWHAPLSTLQLTKTILIDPFLLFKYRLYMGLVSLVDSFAPSPLNFCPMNQSWKSWHLLVKQSKILYFFFI